MRIKLHLRTKPQSILPFNYEYAVSAWIYKILSSADATFAEWLHDRGYNLENDNRKFKLFTYSKIRPATFRVIPRKGLLLGSGQAELTLSFWVDKAIQDFVVGLFMTQRLELKTKGGAISFNITNVELLSKPNFQSVMQFWTMTPIFMSKSTADRPQPIHLSPDDAEYNTLIHRNLLGKVQAIGVAVSDEPLSIKLLKPPKSELLRIGNTKIRAYSFDFEIAAPVPLIEMGYYAGFGGKNSILGLGFCQVKRR